VIQYIPAAVLARRGSRYGYIRERDQGERLSASSPVPRGEPNERAQAPSQLGGRRCARRRPAPRRRRTPLPSASAVPWQGVSGSFVTFFFSCLGANHLQTNHAVFGGTGRTSAARSPDRTARNGTRRTRRHEPTGLITQRSLVQIQPAQREKPQVRGPGAAPGIRGPPLFVSNCVQIPHGDRGCGSPHPAAPRWCPASPAARGAPPAGTGAPTCTRWPWRCSWLRPHEPPGHPCTTIRSTSAALPTGVRFALAWATRASSRSESSPQP
jgi:hypothetical protein